MAARLHVTEAERLSYSRRKLQAISALRNADLDPMGVLQGKVQRPTHSGRWYRLSGPDGAAVYFTTLRQVVAYAQDYRLYTTTMMLLEEDERISWLRWQRAGVAYALALLVRELRAIARQSPQPPERPAAPGKEPTRSIPAPQQAPARCRWPECPYPATGWIDQQPSCAGHAHIYAVCVQASKGIA
jgi:hypothetical protein